MKKFFGWVFIVVFFEAVLSVAVCSSAMPPGQSFFGALVEAHVVLVLGVVMAFILGVGIKWVGE